MSRAPWNVPERIGEFRDLAYVDHLHVVAPLAQAVRLDLPDTAQREYQRRPVWIHRQRAIDSPACHRSGSPERQRPCASGAVIRGVHEPGAICLVGVAVETRIMGEFLVDAGDRKLFVDPLQRNFYVNVKYTIF